MPTSYLIALVLFALSLAVWDIFANQEKCKNFDLANDGQEVEKRDLRYSTRNVRIGIGDFFLRILSTWQHTFKQREDTRTTRDSGDDHRQNLQVDLHKKIRKKGLR